MTSSGKLTVALLLVAGIVSACGTGDSGDEDRLSVVATTTILGDVAREVGGEDVTVEVLTPQGADPHDFRASASQVASLNQADLVVANGLGLEEGLEDVLEAAAADGVRLFEVAPLLDPIPFGFEAGHGEHEEGDHEEGEHEEGEHEGEDGHEHGSEDPHVWLDPVRMAEAARLIGAELSDIDPESDWTERAEAYAEELLAANEEISQTLSSIPEARRLLVTNHEALGYFAERYGFEVIGVVIPGGSTMGDPSSAELADLVDVIEHEGVNAIFGETTQPSALAEAVAAELGEAVQVVNLYTGSLGEPGSDADTLIGMLLTNAESIAEALGG